MSLLTKMAHDLNEIESFLVQFRDKTRPKFLSRLKDMQLFAKKHEMVGDALKPWDYTYYARKLIETETESDPDPVGSFIQDPDKSKQIFLDPDSIRIR
uniref:Peptidase M3A/M3B catalytic domain-containing protein n=1 Tax=Romanomermis culicivorax TaxID=13658 RepID=A0A915IEA2_ROMCU